MSADANTPLGPAGSTSHISGIVPEHRVTNEGKRKNAHKRKQKHTRSPKPDSVRPENIDVEQSSPDSENKEDKGHSIDYLA